MDIPIELVTACEQTCLQVAYVGKLVGAVTWGKISSSRPTWSFLINTSSETSEWYLLRIDFPHDNTGVTPSCSEQISTVVGGYNI